MSPHPPDEEQNHGREEPGLADRADYDPTYEPSAPIACDVCGNIMDYLASCRILCRNCGYTRDCEDP